MSTTWTRDEERAGSNLTDILNEYECYDDREAKYAWKYVYMMPQAGMV